MLYTLPNANGLDFYVERANSRLYNFLLSQWSVAGAQYKSFGRVYRNHAADAKGGDGWIYEYFDPTQTTYAGSGGANTRGGLFFEDSLAVVSFWGLIDTIKKTNDRDDMARMEVIFFVDLSKITPGGITDKTQRLDEVAINDVKNFLQNNGCGFSPMDTVRDVDKVLERCSGAIKKSVLNDNMQPRLCFKIIVQCPYNPQVNIVNQPTVLMPLQRSIVLYIKSSPDTSKTIPVGNGLFIYQEYAEGSTLQPLYTNSNSPYLAGRNVELPFFGTDNVIISLPDYNTGTGKWTRGSDVGGFNDGEYYTITAQDVQHSETTL